MEERLAAIRALEIDEIADAIQEIGFECTRCGACCRGHDDDHVATVFPDEIRRIASDGRYEWRDIVRPMPFGLDDGTGETIEWALQTDGCGDCRFLESTDGTETTCAIYGDRPMICRTYPFTLAESPSGDPLGVTVERVGPVTAHECEGLGRAIERDDSVRLAGQLKRRALHEVEEAIAVMEELSKDRPSAPTVVVDSEGAKRPDGTPLSPVERD